MESAPPRRGLRSSVPRFAIASIAAFATNLGVAVALHELFGVAANVAYGIALVLVLVQSFALLRYFVYGAQTELWVTQFSRYVPPAVAFRSVELAAFLAIHDGLGVDYRIVICIIGATSFATKFVFYRQLVFRG